MPLFDKALSERFDMPRHATRVRPRVRRQKRYAHAFEW
jgi:hypothetical protein